MMWTTNNFNKEYLIYSTMYSFFNGFTVLVIKITVVSRHM